MNEEQKADLHSQAEVSSSTTVFLSKKQILQEGRKIISKIRADVCLC